VFDPLSLKDLKNFSFTCKRAQATIQQYLSTEKRSLLKLRFNGPKVTKIALPPEFPEQDLKLFYHSENIISIWSLYEFSIQEEEKREPSKMKGLVIQGSEIVSWIAIKEDHVTRSGFSLEEPFWIRIEQVQITTKGMVAVVLYTFGDELVILMYSNGQYLRGRVLRRALNCEFTTSASCLLYSKYDVDGEQVFLVTVNWSNPQLKAVTRHRLGQGEINGDLWHLQGNEFFLQFYINEVIHYLIYDHQWNTLRPASGSMDWGEVKFMLPEVAMVNDHCGIGVYQRPSPESSYENQVSLHEDLLYSANVFTKKYSRGAIALDPEDKDRLAVLLYDDTKEGKKIYLKEKDKVRVKDVPESLHLISGTQSCDETTRLLFMMKKNYFIGSGIIVDLEHETQPLGLPAAKLFQSSHDHGKYCVLKEGGLRMWYWCCEKRELTMATWML